MKDKILKNAENIFSNIAALRDYGLAQHGELCEDFFLIAEKKIRIRYDSNFIREYFRWQMNLLYIEKPETWDADVSVWCDDSMDQLYTQLGQNSGSLQLFDDESRIDVYLGNGPRAGKNMFAWRNSTREGWVVISSGSMDKFIGVSHNLAPLFSRMYSFFHARMLHCAAVVIDKKAILISGLSGSGKSTLAAACLNYGMDYSADDTVLYREDDNMVFPICSTLHISQYVIEHLPEINTLVKEDVLKTYPGRAFKKHLDLTPLQSKFVNGAKAVMMICPTIQSGVPYFEKADSMKVLVPLLCSSVKILGLHEYATEYMRGITSKLKSFPTFHFYVGPDLEKNVSELNRFYGENRQFLLTADEHPV